MSVQYLRLYSQSTKSNGTIFATTIAFIVMLVFVRCHSYGRLPRCCRCLHTTFHQPPLRHFAARKFASQSRPLGELSFGCYVDCLISWHFFGYLLSISSPFVALKSLLIDALWRAASVHWLRVFIVGIFVPLLFALLVVLLTAMRFIELVIDLRAKIHTHIYIYIVYVCIVLVNGCRVRIAIFNVYRQQKTRKCSQLLTHTHIYIVYTTNVAFCSANDMQICFASYFRLCRRFASAFDSLAGAHAQFICMH